MQRKKDNKISKSPVKKILKSHTQMSVHSTKPSERGRSLQESKQIQKETQNISRQNQKTSRSVSEKEHETGVIQKVAGLKNASGAGREISGEDNAARPKNTGKSAAVPGEQTESGNVKGDVPTKQTEKEVDKKGVQKDENPSAAPAAAAREKVKRNEIDVKAELLKSAHVISEQREDKQNAGTKGTYVDKTLADRVVTKESFTEEFMDRRLIKAMAGGVTKAHPLDSLDAFCGKDQEKICDAALTAKSARSAELKDLVVQAIKDHKIFCIFNNHWYIVRPVREELLSRGWLEVIPDRRLIPRRRPPPAGPTADRNGLAESDIEAILTAREAFIDEIIEPVAKILPAKPSLDKSNKSFRKSSDESLKDVASEFQIVPPTHEKKKNNVEIREFVSKCKENTGRPRGRAEQSDRERQQGAKGRAKAPSVSKSACRSEMTEPPERRENGKIAGISGGQFRTVDSVKEAAPKDRSEGSGGKGDETLASRALGSSRGKGKIANRKEDSKEAGKASKCLLTESESKIVSKMIQSLNARIHFMWLSIKPAIHLKCFNYSPEIVNKFQKTTFCTKIGLWSHLNNIQWFAPEVNFPAKSPRMYNTGEADDLEAFLQDFQMTACIGILKWLSETFSDKGTKGVQKKKGKVPIKAFEFAIRQCERYMRFRENEDLSAPDEPKVLQEEWDTFLQWFYIITNDNGKVQETSNAQLMVMYTKAVEVLRAMKRYWPEIEADGRLNIWIMKPYYASCGRGIFMTNNVFYITQHSKYIVQKYIERPFLIYNTKFDIRQWFLITKLIPLEIWMYKECYLRFCTQPFALRNLHESVHLSNNSVQRKYVNQDSSLPDQNMWDSNTFQQYLKTIGQPNAWNDVIYPGMRDAIISIMLAAQDTFDCQRKNWFEVYGADFMVSSNLTDGPWLIEINENPAMDPSTKVTSRLCPQMLRDVIKVIVDKRSNKNALTGQWELVYRQNYSPCFGTVDVDIKGKKMAKPIPATKTNYYNSLHASYFLSHINNIPKREDEKKQYETVKSYNVERKGTNDIVSDRQMVPNQNNA